MNIQIQTDSFSSFTKEIKALREKIIYTSEQFLIQEFKKIFEKYSTLQEIHWIVNDANNFHRVLNINWEDVLYAETIGGRTKNTIAENFRENNIKKDLQSFISLFDDELMFDLFGKNVNVFVRKEGIKIEERYNN